jgi:hypothetical protein
MKGTKVSFHKSSARNIFTLTSFSCLGHRIVQTIEDDVKQLVKSAGIQGRVWEQDFGKEACYSRGTLGAQNHM